MSPHISLISVAPNYDVNCTTIMSGSNFTKNFDTLLLSLIQFTFHLFCVYYTFKCIMYIAYCNIFIMLYNLFCAVTYRLPAITYLWSLDRSQTRITLHFAKH